MKKFVVLEKRESYRKIVYEAENKYEARHKWINNENFESCSDEFEVNYEADQIYEVKET